MKRIYCLLAVLPLALAVVGTGVARERVGKRAHIIQVEFGRAFEAKDTKRMIHWLHLGANPNINSDPDWTALYYAVNEFELPLLQALLNAHVDVNRRNSSGEPPLASAISVCGSCACESNGEAAILLLKHGARAEVSYHQRTPLLDSAEMVSFEPEENLRLIPLLLRHGANPLRRDEKKRTAYDIVSASKVERTQEKQRQRVLALLKAAMRKRHS